MLASIFSSLTNRIFLASALLVVVSAFAAMAIEQARLYEEEKLAVVVRLLGDVSHDIKNLLLPVTAGSELLERELHTLFDSLPPTRRTSMQ